jgi:UDP-N-acetylglucosamine:LPS N-acetylglucosamine transferase
MLHEAETSAARLAEHLNNFLAAPEVLAKSAQAARDIGRPGAGQALADLVESLIPANGDPANGDPNKTARRQAA